MNTKVHRQRERRYHMGSWFIGLFFDALPTPSGLALIVRSWCGRTSSGCWAAGSGFLWALRMCLRVEARLVVARALPSRWVVTNSRPKKNLLLAKLVADDPLFGFL
jgi:hypothetical protein